MKAALRCCRALMQPSLSLASAPSHCRRRSSPAATATPIPLPSPDRLLYLIRRQFRSHRPPPPYVTYTLIRKQTLDDGYPDLLNSYTYHIWCRTTPTAPRSDAASIAARRAARWSFCGPLSTSRGIPGRRPPISSSRRRCTRTPVRATSFRLPSPRKPPADHCQRDRLGEFDYRVTRIANEGDQIHVSLHAASRSGPQSPARALRR